MVGSEDHVIERDAVDVGQAQGVGKAVAQRLLQPPAHEIGQLVARTLRVKGTRLAAVEDRPPLGRAKQIGDLLLGVP